MKVLSGVGRAAGVCFRWLFAGLLIVGTFVMNIIGLIVTAICGSKGGSHGDEKRRYAEAYFS